jgi:glycyl-tRNA synthetase beta chain
VSGPRDLLFEIGVEELPTPYIAPALAQLEREAAAGLTERRLGFESVTTLGTPRRLTLSVLGLVSRQTDVDEEAVGPSSKAAFDADGKPTKALLGFCQGKGADPSHVRRVTTPKGEYVAVTVHHAGRPAIEVLPALLASVATRLQFPKSMRWLEDDTRFARPVRWLVALLGDEVVPVAAFGLTAGRQSQGHRFLRRGAVEIASAGAYTATLESAMVMADPEERRTRLARQIETLAAGEKGRCVDDPELLDINMDLVEWPTAFVGAFDPRYLDLPREVIVTALREHQRFFAIESPDGRLMPRFVAARNGDERGLDQVRRGNEGVLTARLEDARFYWETDLEHTPAERVDALAGVVWMEGLGSLRDKAERLESMASWLAERLAPAAAETARRAARLCKTDLLSEMIGSGKEYASLEGVIGGYYARAAGEPEEVAHAIAEHYRPRRGRRAARVRCGHDAGARRQARSRGRVVRGRQGAERQRGSARRAPRRQRRHTHPDRAAPPPRSLRRDDGVDAHPVRARPRPAARRDHETARRFLARARRDRTRRPRRRLRHA